MFRSDETFADNGGAVHATLAHSALEVERDKLFSDFGREFVRPFADWADRALAPWRNSVQTLFYPFGGPDFLFAQHLFPAARNFVLVGNEPAGLARRTGFDQALALEALRHYLRFSYFITRDLGPLLNNPGLSGVLPLLLTQIAHAGLPVHDVAPIGTTGLRILFGPEPSTASLHYFCQDLRDIHFVGTRLHRDLSGYDDLAVFLKSGSYLLHEPPFEHLRDLIRTRASVLVQDPGGVPYRLLRDWGWSTYLHGRFVKDIPVFSKKYDQSELAAAYAQNEGGSALPFGLGYLSDPGTAALIVAAPRGISAS